MSNYDKPRGALFQNNRKEKDSHPDHRGDIEVDKEIVKDLVNQINNGAKFAKFSVSGWNKSGQNSGPFISLSPSKLYVKGDQVAQPAQPVQSVASDDAIPF